MGPNLQALGSEGATSAREIEQFLDTLYTKTHQPAPYVVLTAPFGRSTSPSAPYSTRTGEIAPGHRPTNNWRNNFGIQKGIGCPAESEVITKLLQRPAVRLACPHMVVGSAGGHVCGIAGTAYRGEEHSIWLRMTDTGYQVAPLDNLAIHSAYLIPKGLRIPVFPLIAMLYSLAPTSVYPNRTSVGIPDFAVDFSFSLEQMENFFDCDPESSFNVDFFSNVDLNPRDAGIQQPTAGAAVVVVEPAGGPLPVLGVQREINNGVGAELAVAADLIRCGWTVTYRGNQRSVGYDLQARRESQILRVEVKSSVGFTSPELSESEWESAQRYGDEFVLAVVDFYGSASQAVWYVRNPALTTTPVELAPIVYRLPREEIHSLRTDADFL
jgi:hypothetical protein